MNSEHISTDLVPNTSRIEDFFFHSADYVYRHRLAFILLGVLLLITVLGVYGGYQYQENQAIQRAERLYSLQQQMSEADFLQNQGAALDRFIKENQGSAEAHIALLQRANLRSKANQLIKAEYDLRTLLQEMDPKVNLYPLVAMYLANILRDQEKPEEALSLLLEAKAKRNSEVILIELGEIYSSLNRPQEAKEVLNELKGQFPNSLFIERANRLLELM